MKFCRCVTVFWIRISWALLIIKIRWVVLQNILHFIVVWPFDKIYGKKSKIFIYEFLFLKTDPIFRRNFFNLPTIKNTNNNRIWNSCLFENNSVTTLANTGLKLKWCGFPQPAWSSLPNDKTIHLSHRRLMLVDKPTKLIS